MPCGEAPRAYVWPVSHMVSERKSPPTLLGALQSVKTPQGQRGKVPRTRWHPQQTLTLPVQGRVAAGEWPSKGGWMLDGTVAVCHSSGNRQRKRLLFPRPFA